MHVLIAHVDNSRFKLLSGLSFPCLQSLLGAVSKVRHRPHTNLIFPGDTLEHIFIIESGWVKLYRLNEQGQESICSMVGPGDSLMADLLFYPHPSPLGATTTTECELLMLPTAHIRQVLRNYPELATKLMEETTAISLNRMHLIEQVTVQTAPERVGNFMLITMLESRRQPSTDFELPFGKSTIAHYLNLTPATFSRCLKYLAQYGISIANKRIQLHSLQSLCKFCDSHTATKCLRKGECGFCRHSSPQHRKSA